mmetsp:Transcript_78240/g.198868  ORF Transcript_78240/g.198868 Transcript_78240/m.198868 type:complete len:248 (-) Transcript_78240:703-1446(-)
MRATAGGPSSPGVASTGGRRIPARGRPAAAGGSSRLDVLARPCVVTEGCWCVARLPALMTVGPSRPSERNARGGGRFSGKNLPIQKRGLLPLREHAEESAAAHPGQWAATATTAAPSGAQPMGPAAPGAAGRRLRRGSPRSASWPVGSSPAGCPGARPSAAPRARRARCEGPPAAAPRCGAPPPTGSSTLPSPPPPGPYFRRLRSPRSCSPSAASPPLSRPPGARSSTPPPPLGLDPPRRRHRWRSA